MTWTAAPSNLCAHDSIKTDASMTFYRSQMKLMSRDNTRGVPSKRVRRSSMSSKRYYGHGHSHEVVTQRMLCVSQDPGCFGSIVAAPSFLMQMDFLDCRVKSGVLVWTMVVLTVGLQLIIHHTCLKDDEACMKPHRPPTPCMEHMALIVKRASNVASPCSGAGSQVRLWSGEGLVHCYRRCFDRLDL